MTNLHNKATVFDVGKANKEKLMGRFDLKINIDLPFNKKVQKYAQDPMGYYLHKQGNFLEKI